MKLLSSIIYAIVLLFSSTGCSSYPHQSWLEDRSLDKIADDLLEDQEIIEKIYNVIRKYPDKDEKEICNFLI